MRRIKLVFLAILLLTISCCGNKTNKFSQSELEEIHQQEVLLKQQLLNKTWHYYDEPTRAVQYLEDGSYINFLSSGIRSADYFTGDDGTWDVKYCGSLDANTRYLDEENDKEKALKYYDYNVVVSYVNYEGKDKTYTLTIEFSDGDLILGGDRLYDGPSIIEHIPDNLYPKDDLLNHVWYIDGMNYYILFFDNNLAYATYNVFADGSTNGSYLYRWGYDETDNLFYLMNYYNFNDEIVEDVQEYILEENAGPDYRLAETWSNGGVTFDMNKVDGKDESAIALLNAYDMLKKWSADNWGD